MTARKPTPKTNAARTDARARAAQAVHLRAEGLTYREIADRVGYSTENAANKAVLSLLSRTEFEAAETLRGLESMRLNGLWRKTILGIERSEASPQGLSAALVSAAVRISERRARLLGLDAPTRVDVDLDAAHLRREFLDIMHPTEPTGTDDEA